MDGNTLKLIGAGIMVAAIVPVALLLADRIKNRKTRVSAAIFGFGLLLAGAVTSVAGGNPIKAGRIADARILCAEIPSKSPAAQAICDHPENRP